MTAPAFVKGELDTALIERERAHLFAPRRETTRDMWESAAKAAWAAACPPVAGVTGSPWSDRRGWSSGVRGERRLTLREGEVEREIAGVLPGAASNAVVAGNEVHLFSDGEHRVFEWVDPYLPAAEHADAHGGLRAVMPGRVLAVHVKPGDAVAKGAPLVVLEAMKMEQTITAPSAGKIERVLCAVGDQVREGAELLTFADAN
jgi:3-methylcrotonyl-CoA carboxylase alpha subunit